MNFALFALTLLHFLLFVFGVGEGWGVGGEKGGGWEGGGGAGVYCTYAGLRSSLSLSSFIDQGNTFISVPQISMRTVTVGTGGRNDPKDVGVYIYIYVLYVCIYMYVYTPPPPPRKRTREIILTLSTSKYGPPPPPPALSSQAPVEGCGLGPLCQ